MAKNFLNMIPKRLSKFYNSCLILVSIKKGYNGENAKCRRWTGQRLEKTIREVWHQRVFSRFFVICIPVNPSPGCKSSLDGRGSKRRFTEGATPLQFVRGDRVKSASLIHHFPIRKSYGFQFASFHNSLVREFKSTNPQQVPNIL